MVKLFEWEEFYFGSCFRCVQNVRNGFLDSLLDKYTSISRFLLELKELLLTICNILWLKGILHSSSLYQGVVTVIDLFGVT